MTDFGSFNDQNFSSGGSDGGFGDLLGDDNDPNDDFDPLMLLQSPLFGENRGRGSVTNSAMTDDDNNDDGNDYSGYNGEQERRQQRQQQQQAIPSQMASMTPQSSSATPGSPPFSSTQNNFSTQAPPPGSAGFAPQFGGVPSQQQQQPTPGANPSNMAAQMKMNGMGVPGAGGMPANMNAAAMNNNFAMQQAANAQMNSQLQAAAAAGMNVNGMNAAALNQMNQLQGMQQALRMQAAAGNAMQGNPMQAAGNPMMNAMQGGPGMPPGQFPPGANAMQVGPMGPGSMQQMQAAGMDGSMNRNGSLNNAVPNLNGAMSGMNLNQNGTNAAFHGSLQNIQGGQFPPQQRGGSLPTSPNPVPSVAQLSASIRQGNSSRSGGRTRGPTPKVDANGKVIANTSSDPGINEAMEKLCESMRRSAMSRNLVKQLSGRSVQRSASGRSLSRSNSGVGMRKQLSGRSLSGNLGMGDDSGRGTPTRAVPIRRLSDAKHRMHRAAPGHRGAFRTNSASAVTLRQGQASPKTFLHLDDQSLGAL